MVRFWCFWFMAVSCHVSGHGAMSEAESVRGEKEREEGGTHDDMTHGHVQKAPSEPRGFTDIYFRVCLI